MESRQPTCVIIEDEDEMRELLITQLGRIKLVEVVASYDDSIKGAMGVQKLKPDLLLLDVNVKGMEGPYFMEALQHKPKIIVISGYTEDVMNNFQLTYDLLLSKPTTTDSLKRAVEMVLR